MPDLLGVSINFQYREMGKSYNINMKKKASEVNSDAFSMSGGTPVIDRTTG